MTKMTFLLIAISALISCQESGKVSPDVEKYEKQMEELDVLGRELTELRIQVAATKTDGPKVPVKDLSDELKDKEDQLNKLNAEFEILTKSKEKALKDFEEYKAKYPLQ